MSWSSQIAVLYRALLNQFISFTQRPLSKLALLAWCRAQIYCSARALTRSLKDCRLPRHASLLRLKNLQRHRLSRLVSCANLLFCASAGSPAALSRTSAFKGISLAYETRRQWFYCTKGYLPVYAVNCMHTILELLCAYSWRRTLICCIPREFHLSGIGIPKNISQCTFTLSCMHIVLYPRISPSVR